MAALKDGEGGLPNAEATVNYACKRLKYADTRGRGVKKRSNFADIFNSFLDGP